MSVRRYGCLSHNKYVIQRCVLDCDEQFRDAGELLDHTKDMHENSDLLPSTNPVPYSQRTLDPLPGKVPSWSIFPASVTPVPISADRHSQIGRWVSFTFDEIADLILIWWYAPYGDPRHQVARNISGTAKRADSSKRLRGSRRFDPGEQKTTASEMEDMMNEERFGFLSSTDDGNTLFADIPSEAVSLSCRYGLLTLSDGDGHHEAPRESRGERSEVEESEVEDGLVRADAPVGEDAIGLELGPAPSDDDLLLRPASP